MSSALVSSPMDLNGMTQVSSVLCSYKVEHRWKTRRCTEILLCWVCAPSSWTAWAASACVHRSLCDNASCPVWVCAGNEEKCLSLPCSAYWLISAFLNRIFGRGRGRNYITKLDRETGSLSIFTPQHYFAGWQWWCFTAGRSFLLGGILLEVSKACSPLQPLWWRAHSSSSSEHNCCWQPGCCPFLLTLENTNEMLHHLHCLCPHFVLGKEKAKQVSDDALFCI